MNERDALAARIHALFDACAAMSSDTDDALRAARDALLDDVFAYQAARIPAYGRLCAHARARGDALVPAVPTDVFRTMRLASFPPDEDIRIFRTSGTTSGARGAHPMRDLALYDHAARVMGARMLFPDVARMRLVLLVPSEREVIDSSLGYMIARFAEWFGTEVTWAIREGALDERALVGALDAAIAAKEPVALLGTSFAFVHADDALASRRFALPDGSRIMQTGGFKGRSRTVEPDAMRAMLTDRYGVRDAFVVAEYGMTELSSQLWESTLRDAVLGRAGARRLVAPAWLRVLAVDPATLAPATTEGLCRVDDMANLDGIAAVQTADRIRVVDDGVVVLGRAEGATPRGCSIAADAMLGGAGS